MNKRIIPDAITSCNLLCGCIATFLATQNAFLFAFFFILGGAFFDFFDGMSSRLLHAPSRIGVELDSLADDITFGLAPAMILFCYLRPLIGWWSLIVLLMAAFSALRLAKFNVDDKQTSSFVGLATPANAIFWASLCSMPYAITAPAWMPWVMVGLSLVSCYLLVSKLPMCSLKFHNLSWKDNSDKYIFLIGVLILVAFCVIKAAMLRHWELSLFAGVACILWYVLINILFAILKK